MNSVHYNNITCTCYNNIASQQTDGNALCAFRQGITNWPSNPTTAPTVAPTASLSVSPTAFAPTLYPTISPATFAGWTCNGVTAVSPFPVEQEL